MQIRCEKCREWFKAEKFLSKYFICKCGHDNSQQVKTAFISAGILAMDHSLCEE